MSRVAAHNFSPSTDISPFSTSRNSSTLEELMKDSTEPLQHAVDVGTLAKPTHQVPFVLSFQNVTYNVKVGRKGGSKCILSDVSGKARDGEILAVLGPSGSGKSTLIDALANRIQRKSISGSITLNGEPLESKMIKNISSYVMQDDLLLPMLTVQETLMFAAELRLPRTLSNTKKKARVLALMDQLGLGASANTIIGNEGHRGVSGGERRRVSIGIDVVHDPIILFLDEPTSGLDSTSAYMVIRVLQRIARAGSVVVLSVHQPSHRILGLLDCTLFLSGGKVFYNGPPSGLQTFFSDFGRPIPAGENLTEYALDLIIELESTPGRISSIVDFHKGWQGTRGEGFLGEEREMTMPLKMAIAASMERGKVMSGRGRVSGGSGFANPMWAEISTLSRRWIANSRRQPELFGMRMGTVLVTAVLLATLYWRLDNSPRGAQERLSFMAFAIATTFYTSADALPTFIMERFIFMRETAHNAYRRSSYVICYTLVSIPTLVILSLAFSTATFWSVGLAGGMHGFIFYALMIFASYWCGCSFVTFLSAVVPHVILGYIVVVAILAYFLLFSGFFVNRDRIPSYWLWFHYMSLIKYSYEGVLLSEFRDPNRCFVRGLQMFDFTPLAKLPDDKKVDLLRSISNTLGFPVTNTTCVTTSVDLLSSQGIGNLSKWTCLWIIIAIGFLFRFLFYVALLLGSKLKRR